MYHLKIDQAFKKFSKKQGLIPNPARSMGYTLSFEERTSGPINAIYFDWKHNSMWGGSSNHGEDYGIGW